jgi:hypothetical protein
VHHKCEFGREHPPFTFKREVTALHLAKGDILPPADLANMLVQAVAQRALAFGNFL